MKRIKVREEYKPFLAALDASRQYELSHNPIPVPENDALEIENRWGALLTIETMPLDEAATHMAATAKEEVVTSSDEQVEVRVTKRTRAKKDDGLNS